jgi:hypothetical protein
MSREERIELMTSVVTKLDEAAMLLTQAEEAIFADQVDELADLIAVVAIPGEGRGGIKADCSHRCPTAHDDPDYSQSAGHFRFVGWVGGLGA